MRVHPTRRKISNPALIRADRRYCRPRCRGLARMRSASGSPDAVFQSGDLSGDGNDVHRIYRDGSKFLQILQKHATQAVAESQLKEELVKYCQERLNRELIDQTASVLETESDETAYFKRSAAMKQLISENFLNLDEEYLDHFIDEMYGQIYPNE